MILVNMHEISEVMNLIDVLVWSWHVMSMKWLFIKVTWNWYEHDCDID